jgi:predicted transcriptional regulator
MTGINDECGQQHYDAWYRQKVTASLSELARGEFLTHEELGARLKTMFQGAAPRYEK